MVTIQLFYHHLQSLSLSLSLSLSPLRLPLSVHRSRWLPHIADSGSRGVWIAAVLLCGE